tara:strand:- start:1204 stop:1392 length:189 start_codon:yes stop_codon:yes gene_type:complete
MDNKLTIDDMIKHIIIQIDYHKEKEKERLVVRDYKECVYHSNRIGTLKDLIIWYKITSKALA